MPDSHSTPAGPAFPIVDDPAWFDSLLAAGPPSLAGPFGDPAGFRLQLLISEVDDAPSPSGPRLIRHAFRADHEYFYPASTIKLCAAVAALQTLARLRAEHRCAVDPRTPLVIHPAFPDQRVEDRDRSNLDAGVISVEHEIRKLALVSDNPAHNRLYTLVGHREINELMWSAGLSSVRINHRLSDPRTPEQNRRVGRVDLLAGSRVITLPPRESDLLIDNASPSPIPGLDIGREHFDRQNRISGPMSFLHKNRISLVDLQNLLILVARPDIPVGLPGFALSASDRALLLSALTEYPRQSRNPRYADGPFPDHFVKYLLPGFRRVWGPDDEGLTITNKVGQAYGFTIENALVRSPRLARDLLITAVIYANSSGLLGADTYDDATVALPFMADLAEALARRLGR